MAHAKRDKAAFLTVVAGFLITVVYPMFITISARPTPGALVVVTLAAVSAWAGFLWNRESGWFRWLIQLPAAGFVSYVVVMDAAVLA